jgi:amino acid adenylation domain-containing protein
MFSSLERPATECAEGVATYPLSALQEGLLFDTLLAEDSGRSIEQLVLDLDGRVNADRLRAAWQAATARHDALRTSFRLTPDGPVQDVRQNVTVPFAIEDVAIAGSAERGWYVNACVQAERRRAFSPGIPPLQRVRLLRFGADAQTLIWTNHHAIMDGRARAVVMRDIVEAYCGRPPAQPATPYRSYISWLERQDFSRSEAFWRERLRGFPAATPLPAAFRASGNALSGAPHDAVKRTLFGADTARLLAMARDGDLTINTLLQGAWALLLSRHAAVADVVFGAVRAGRRSAIDGSEVVGLMINTPPVRVHVDESGHLIPWLQEVRSRWDDLRDDEHVPHRTVYACSEITAPQRLFESLIVYERETFMRRLNDTIDPEGVLGVRRARMFDQTAFPLLLVAAGTDELELRLQYDPARFGASDAERLLDHVVTILRGFPDHAEGRVSDVPMLPPKERERIISEWNRTTPYPENATVPGLFAEHVRRTPDAVAVLLDEETLTYGELDARSERIAANLHELGVMPGAFVGVHVERSFGMIAALLGILKAGAASIALDMNYPPERLAAILTDAEVRVILSQAPSIEVLEPVLRAFTSTAPRVVDVDTLAPGQISRAERPIVRALDPAHVMYTSGSTGVPKGAVIPHQAIVRTVRGTDYLRFAPDETFFAFVPLTFDVSVLEVWGPLLNGARLVLCPPGLPSLDVLAGTIERQRVTTLWLTTALFEQMVEEELPRLHGLRQLIVGGDVMSPAHARRVLAAFPSLRLLNVYGPTEATVLITAQHLAEPPYAPIPLGAPIPNATVYVLDSGLRPVPIGVPGEIYTGGAGVALGYLHAPGLTAERFLPDPFSRRPGATMYRSGDLGRWRDDGTIEFLGRADSQVKIRGMRIELGAIESALTDHPAVKEAVVVARAIPPEGKQLVAYVVARGSTPPKARDIQTFLAARLPRHSVPACVAFVSAIPRTATGKFDRKALPDRIDVFAAGEVPSRRAAESAAEIAVAGHVAAILGLDDIGLDDDFYAFGGDSLRAMRLIARLREAFGVSLTVRDLLAAPTVAALTNVLNALHREPARSATPRVRAERASGSLTPIFFMHGDLIGGGRYSTEIARRLPFERPFYAVSPHGTNGGILPSSIEAMARENCAAIRERVPRGPVILGGFCNGGVVAFETARQLEADGFPVEALTIVDGFLFNTERSPLEALLRKGAREQLERLGLRRAAHSQPVAAASWEAWHEELVESWYDALARYVPRPYAGNVSLLWSDEIAVRSADLMRAWKRVAQKATGAGIVPGSHLTAITRYLAQTSDRIAAVLERGAG